MSLRSSIGRVLRWFTDSPTVPRGLDLAPDVYIGHGVVFDYMHVRHISIGEGATIVGGARILAHDASSYRRTGLTWVAPVRIGARAFIGADSVILPGITIGDDAVIAAGSVVTRDVEPGSIVGGSPAKVIGSVAELDARRRELAKTSPVFDETTHKGRELADNVERQLMQAAESGGYFLARPDVIPTTKRRP